MLGPKKTVDLLLKYAREHHVLEKLAQHSNTNLVFRAESAPLAPKSPPPRPYDGPAFVDPDKHPPSYRPPEVHALLDDLIGHENADKFRSTRLGSFLNGVQRGTFRAAGDVVNVLGGDISSGVRAVDFLAAGPSEAYDRGVSNIADALNAAADRQAEANELAQLRNHGYIHGKRVDNDLSVVGERAARGLADAGAVYAAWPVLERLATSTSAPWTAARLLNANGMLLYSADLAKDGNLPGAAAYAALGALGAAGPLKPAGATMTRAGKVTNTLQRHANRITAPLNSRVARVLPSAVQNHMPVIISGVPAPDQLRHLVYATP